MNDELNHAAPDPCWRWCAYVGVYVMLHVVRWAAVSWGQELTSARGGLLVITFSWIINPSKCLSLACWPVWRIPSFVGDATRKGTRKKIKKKSNILPKAETNQSWTSEHIIPLPGSTRAQQLPEACPSLWETTKLISPATIRFQS